MKKIFTIFALFASLGIFAQNKVAEKVAELQSANTLFKHIAVLNAETIIPDREVSKVVDKATFATIRMQEVNAIATNKYDAIEIEIPYQSAVIVAQLYKVDPFSEGFHVDTDKSKSVPYEKGAYYRGIIKGDSNSLVSMNFFQGEMNGVLSAEGINNLVVGKLVKPNNTNDYIIYSDADMKVLNDFNCGVVEDTPEGEHEHEGEDARNVQTTRCVTMYFEIDHNLYLENDSDVTQTTNWMTSVFNNVQTLYTNDNINVSLKSMYIWTTNDPYVGNSSADYLNQFNSVRPVFDGDVGQLVGIDPNGLGGVAVTINGLCSQNNYSYSDVNIGYSTVPTYSWTIQVITHEMGHLLGSRHTHACVWNGNNTSIDGCGTQAGYNEGTCALGPIPNGTVKGTIMSYCHLIGGVGISFTNGFGSQPRLAIQAAVDGGLCLSTDCINTCINTVTGINASNITNTTATINWTDGSATSWQIWVSTFPATLPTWTTVTSPTYNAIGLNPNTYYKVRIRPVCSAGMISTYRQIVFATTANWCSGTGITITDTGGASGDYTNEQSYVRTFIPTVPDKKITLAFTAFDLELDFDYIYIYDGANPTAPDLSAGGFTGTTIPGPFASTAANGALTMVFFSDQGVVEGGYVATVGCEDSLGLNGSQKNIDFTYYPNPTNGQVSIVSNTEMTEIAVYNIAGQLLYHNKMNTLDTKVDISAYANGTYFFKLKFGEMETNFKILKM